MGDGLDEERERRALQERAYGRGPTPLSPAEADRLRDLQRRRVVPAGPEVSAVVDTAAPGEGPAPGPEAWFASVVAEDAATTTPPHVLAVPKEPGSDPVTVAADPGSSSIGPSHVLGETAPPSRWRALLADRAIAGWWRRPRVLVTAAAALVAAGLAIGWSVPRAPDVALPMTAAHEERREVLTADVDDIDPGSLLLLAEEGDSRLWWGTRGDGRVHCGILDIDDEQPEVTCLRSTQWEVQDVLSVHRTVTLEDERGVSYSGGITLAQDRYPLGFLQRWEYDSSVWDNADYSPAQKETARRLVREEDLQGLPLVVGYLDDDPVWFVTSQGGESCLITEFGGPRVRACGDADPRTGVSQVAGDRSLVVLEVPAGAAGSAVLDLRTANMHGQYLVITRQSDPSTAWGPRL